MSLRVLLATLVAAALTLLFLYSLDQALQDADRRLPAEHPRTYPSTSMHREGSP